MLLLVLATFAQPARAGITAEYYVWGPIGPTMEVQVADNGDARVEMGGHLAAIRREGVMYLVRRDAQGSFVVRKDEFDRIEAQLDGDLGTLFPESEIEGATIIEAGEENVGGRRGTVFFIGQPGYAEYPGTAGEMAFVVSRDPDLQPVGEIVAEFFGRSGDGFSGPVLRHVADIFARGTLIRMWFMVRLERTSSGPIAPSAFELPAPVVSGEEARRRLGPAW